MDRRFFHRLGASQLERNICSAAGEAGLKSVIGIKLGTEPEQFAHSRYIIAWGANIHGNNVHLWPFIEEARRKGAQAGSDRSLQDPDREVRRLVSAHQSRTDAALALGMMHVIISEGLHDADYVARIHVGFRPAAREGTGISAGEGREVDWHFRGRHRQAGPRVRDHAAGGDPGELWRAALGRRRHGDARHHDVAVHTGSWKEVGGGLQLSISGASD